MQIKRVKLNKIYTYVPVRVTTTHINKTFLLRRKLPPHDHSQ